MQKKDVGGNFFISHIAYTLLCTKGCSQKFGKQNTQILLPPYLSNKEHSLIMAVVDLHMGLKITRGAYIYKHIWGLIGS